MPNVITDIGEDHHYADIFAAVQPTCPRHDGLKDDVALSAEDRRRVRLALPVALLIEVEPALLS